MAELPGGPSAGSEAAAGSELRARLAGLHAAELMCEMCGRATRHRILRVARERPTPEGRRIEGTARCSQCRWTHPFQLALPVEKKLPAIVSTGSRSAPMVVRAASTLRLQVGSRVPGHEPPLRIVRIDLRTGGSGHEALVRDVRTLWLVPEGPRVIPVSLVLGSRTATTRATLPPEHALVVGEPITVGGGTLRIVGLRARNRTWTRPGDSFPAGDVVRIYCRRMESPPAGKRRWRRSREMPSSPAISTSRFERSRSSPGTRTRRSRPWARSASGGAATHRDSPS